MRARLLHLPFPTSQKLRRLKKEAETDGAHRVAQRIHAVLLNHDGHRSGDIAQRLDAPRAKASPWLRDYEQPGCEGLLDGRRAGRPVQLGPVQRRQLEDIIDSGPQAYGFLSGVWSAPRVPRRIAEEFQIDYSDRHVRRLLHALGFPVQRPKRLWARADPVQPNRWRRDTYPNLKKKPRRNAPK